MDQVRPANGDDGLTASENIMVTPMVALSTPLASV